MNNNFLDTETQAYMLDAGGYYNGHLNGRAQELPPPNISASQNRHVMPEESDVKHWNHRPCQQYYQAQGPAQRSGVWTVADSLNLKLLLQKYFRLNVGQLPRFSEYARMEPVLREIDKKATRAFVDKKLEEIDASGGSLKSKYTCSECLESKPRKASVQMTTHNVVSHKKGHIACSTCQGTHGIRGLKQQASRYMRWCCEHHCFSMEASPHTNIFSKTTPVCCMHGIQCEREREDCCSNFCVHLGLLWSCCQHGAACTYYQPQLPVGIYYENDNDTSVMVRKLPPYQTDTD